jgi:hypothetical protein
LFSLFLLRLLLLLLVEIAVGSLSRLLIAVRGRAGR